MEYIIYCRKSTEDNKRQIQSIESQLKELQKIAEERNLKIKKIYTESMSAKAPGRPKFNEMMSYIEKNPNMGILAWKLDRLARNPVDGGRLIWAIEKEIILEIATYERMYKNTIDDKFIMNLDFGVSKMYVDQLSINVKRGNRTKLEKGGWPGQAPLGYLNNKADNTIFIDKKLSGYIIRMFELCKTGKYSFQDMSDILFEEGLRTKSGNKVFKGSIERVLKKKFYYGMMEKNGILYPGNHEPLITKELFDNVRETIEERSRPKERTLFFPFRGFLKCASCDCAYTASIKRGHDYYYCTNGKHICNAHKSYMRSESINELIAEEFEKLIFSERLINVSYEAYKVKRLQNTNYKVNVRDNLYKELQLVQKKKQKLLDAYLSDIVSKNDYEAKIKELGNNKTEIESQIQRLNNQYGLDENTLEQIKNIFLTANRTKNDFLNSNDKKKKNVLDTILWNVKIDNKKIACSRFKEPYNILVNTPKNCDFQTMLGDRDSNPN